MGHLINHANIGEVQKTAYLTAKITSVDSENDAVDFTGIGKCPSGSNIPLFYHCSHDVEQRSNGALEGAAGAFSEDDEVIVQCEIIGANQYKVLRVIGFTDKPKVCAFYIDITVNGFTPAYFKTIKLIDNNGMVHIKDSTSDEPARVGPFSDIAFPAKVYLYMEGNAPSIENDSRMLFSYFTANPVKEFTVCVETWVEGSTITVDGIVLGNGEQQKFSWDFVSKTWSPVSGGVDDDTTLFMANKTNPESTGYNQACKKEVVNAYEGTRILLTHGNGEPQTMGDIYDYCFSAKKVHTSFYGCDRYRPYYGLVENLPIYGPPYESVVEDLYYLDAWRVAYLLMDDDAIESRPTEPINFTASRLGSLMVKDTHTPGPECTCSWPVIEKSWSSISDIKYNAYPNFIEYLIVAIMGRDVFGFPYDDTPHDCYGRPWGPWFCGSVACDAFFYTEIGDVDLPAMGIMTDSDGHNVVFGQTSLNINYIGQHSICQLFDEHGELISTICEIDIPLNSGARKYEFKMISTPEHRI